MSDITYDPNVIKEFSKNLYEKAESIIFMNAIFGFFIGGAIGFMLGPSVSKDYLIAFILLGCFIGVAIGHNFGKLKALDLKVLGQMVLCIKQIEENTKKDAKTDKK